MGQSGDEVQQTPACYQSTIKKMLRAEEKTCVCERKRERTMNLISQLNCLLWFLQRELSLDFHGRKIHKEPICVGCFYSR